MHRHDNTFLGLKEIGSRALPYRANFEFEGEFIDQAHARIASHPLLNGLLIQLPNGPNGAPVPGWLQRADALKLYELAYFSAGDILELGSFHGLSAMIMSMAVQEARRSIRIHTVDLDSSCTEQAVANLALNGLAEHVDVACDEAGRAIKRLASESRKFGFTFVDHSHAYEPVLEVCKSVHQVLLPGSFVLFHDFNDPRNRNAGDGGYAVYQAVMDGLPGDLFDFYGIYGCAALYRLRP
ncbi:MAG: class I SAM-dependent methyltransferase [Acidobacteriia bacterium]|nr:class I SAM-dependent methyltransferase [Terriglobia bacterium]